MRQWIALCAVLAASVQAMHAIELADDTTHLNANLSEVVVESHVRGNYLSGVAIEKRELISTVGLRKMACCTLAESFENSASVSVGYSDAVSGARQIRMLGLAGTYTQFLDESRPFMRGLSAPFALSYTPGDWLKSIQVSKGVASVTAGHEAITGQINLDYRKPTDDERLRLNLYLDDMLRPELNLTSALPLKADKTLATIIMLHAAADTDWRQMKAMDRNHDGFRDQPGTRQLDVANRWVWLPDNGMQLRWGGRYTAEQRRGGQLHFDFETARQNLDAAVADIKGYGNNADNRDKLRLLQLYGSEITNHAANAYVKVALPLRHIVTDATGQAMQDNVALVADYDHFDSKSFFGYNQYHAHENSASVNIRWDHYFSTGSTLSAGLQGKMSFVRGQLVNFGFQWLQPNSELWWFENVFDEHMDEREVGAYAEWTHTLARRLTLVAGLRADYNDWAGHWFVTPRMHLKCDITPRTVLRASAGLGRRTPRAIIENIGMLATGFNLLTGQRTLPPDLGGNTTDRQAQIDDRDYRHMEKALTVGGSLTQTFGLGRDHNASISADYFHTRFYRSLVATQEPWGNAMMLYSSTGDNYSHTWQLDFNWTPVERLDVLATMRYTHSRIELPQVMEQRRVLAGSQLLERALMSRFKGLVNLSYATRFRIWVFDLTAQLNGPMRVPGGLLNTEGSYQSPTYGQLFAQVTHKIGKAEVYLGCENITDYRQSQPIVAADEPFSPNFNSMNVWGPLMGRKFYVGMRWNMY